MYCSKTAVINKTGLHARPASFFVKEAMKYKSHIIIRINSKEYNAKSILNVLSAGIHCGTEIELAATGADEVEAVEGLIAAIQSGLGE